MDQLNNLDAWKVLALVCQTGSMSAAAEAADVEVSTVSRLIAGLERALGRDLVQRSSRPIVISEEGRAAVAAITPILKAHAAFCNRLINDTSAMSGTIRLAVAGGLMHSKLMPLLLDFQKLYPAIDFDVTSTRPISDLLNGRLDVASVSGEITDKGFVSLARGRSVFIPVASPAYLSSCGVPRRPEDLIHHKCFVYTGPVRPHTEQLEKNGCTRPLTLKNRMQSTDILMIKKAVLDGLGVAVDLPLLQCANELASGELTAILDGWHRPPIQAYAVCSAAGWHIRRIRVFMQWYCNRFTQEFLHTERIARQVLGPECRHYFGDDAPEQNP